MLCCIIYYNIIISIRTKSTNTEKQLTQQNILQLNAEKEPSAKKRKKKNEKKPLAQYKYTVLRVGGRLAHAALHSPDEPSELSQWPGHDDSTINIVVVIIIIIINISVASE